MCTNINILLDRFIIKPQLRVISDLNIQFIIKNHWEWFQISDISMLSRFIESEFIFQPYISYKTSLGFSLDFRNSVKAKFYISRITWIPSSIASLLHSLPQDQCGIEWWYVYSLNESIGIMRNTGFSIDSAPRINYR